MIRVAKEIEQKKREETANSWNPWIIEEEDAESNTEAEEEVCLQIFYVCCYICWLLQ